METDSKEKIPKTKDLFDICNKTVMANSMLHMKILDFLSSCYQQFQTLKR